ncbi:MAG: S-layer homology domain-containing protein [Oscillospiraceae bacterium]|nr:S-layer homology domain-containing protein [Oscillospiraceae bacterium]
MKRCIAVLLILCLLLACPRALAADEPPAEQETETAGESLPETGEGEEAPPAPEADEPGEEIPPEAEAGELGEETEEPEEAVKETEETETDPEDPGEGPGSEPEGSEGPEESYVPGQFSDVDESRWYGTEGQGVIRLVWELGLMNGMGNGTFLPEGSLRICEAVKLAAVIRSRALDDGAEFPAAQPWYQPYVKYAVAEGILQRGEFADRMEEAVTRGELAHILAAALPEEELPHINAIFAIPDVISLDTEPAGYWQDILTLYRAGVMLGDGGTHAYRPDSRITRAETAAAVVRMALPEERQRLELLPLNGASGPLPEAGIQRDNDAALTLGYHPWEEFFAFVEEEQAEESADLWLSMDHDDSRGYPLYGEEGCRILAVYPRYTIEYLIADRDPQGMYVLRLEGAGRRLEDKRGVRIGTSLRALLAAFPDTELTRESGDADVVWYSCTIGDPAVEYRYGVGWDGYVMSISMAIPEED